MWADWPLPAGSVSLTAEEAQARQNEALAEGVHLTWFVGFVTDADGAVMARAHTPTSRAACSCRAAWWRRRWTSCGG